MIEVYRRIGDRIVPVLRVNGGEYSDDNVARAYGLYGLDENEIKNKLWDNPYLGWREVHE